MKVIMNKIYKIFIFILIILTNVSCNYFYDDFEYEIMTIKFVKDLLMKNYDNCINEMEIKNEDRLMTNDSIKISWDIFRNEIISELGKKLEFEIIKAKTTYPLLSKEKHYTNIIIQIQNKKQFSLLEIILNENNKVKKFDKYNIKENIPKMEIFWLISLCTIWIPFFIYS